MFNSGSNTGGSSGFRRIGRLVYGRRRIIIIVWILALIALVPVILQEGNVTSLQQGSATGSQLESVQASNIISAQFARTVPNSTLLIVVSGKNVTSVSTQRFIGQLVHDLKVSPTIRGLNQTVDVYSPLYATIRGLNKGAYSAVGGANSTGRLLFGVPGAYIGVWEKAYSASHDVTSSDQVAYNSTTKILESENATAYKLYTSHVLSLFDTAWGLSWSDPHLSNYSVVARGSLAAQSAGKQYFDQFSPGSKTFGDALLNSVTLSEFLADSKGALDARFASFAVSYVANSTGFSERLVNASYALGRSYDNSSLYSLSGSVVSKTSDYSLGRSLSSLISSLVSPARDTTLISLGLKVSSNDNVVAVRSVVASALQTSGAGSGVQSALVTGGDAISYDFGNSTLADLGLILPVTIALLIVATGLFFRSVLTPFISLGTIGVALGISQVFIVLVGTYISKVDFTIPTILLTVLIGVGTDYSVFVIARYREERVRGADVQSAIETSVTWAGESIATSGATVIISFLSLSFTSVVFLRTMGLVVGFGVLVALSVALTMVPAIVGMVGGKTFWPNSGARFVRYSDSVLSKLERKRGYFSRSGAFAVKRATPLIVIAVIATIPAIFVYATTTPTYDFLSAAPSSLDSVAASNHLTNVFGAGTLSPTYVVITFTNPLVTSHSFDSSEMSTVQSVSSFLAKSADVRNVTSPTTPFGVPVSYDRISYSTPSGKQTFLGILQNIGKDNKTALFTVNFIIDPYSTQALNDAQKIRQTLHSSYGTISRIDGVFVGGASGSILDTKNVFDSEFNSVVPIVAVGVALVLLIVLGSLFLPVFAVLSVLMSIVWTLAVTRFVFQQFFAYQILFITPFFLFVTLLGLGMDYNIFILTRIREDATKGKHLHDAIVSAIEQTGGIITAAAIILAGSLGALMLSSDLLLKQIGFSFAFSILIDALIVRTYLVPAVMSKVGKWNWYNPIPFLNRSKSLFERDNPPR